MFIVLFDIYTHLYLFADKLDFGICRNPTALQYTRILQYVEHFQSTVSQWIQTVYTMSEEEYSWSWANLKKSNIFFD
jgi:hypothetical protein